MDDIQDWYGPDMATFGDRVAAAREMAGMSQAELARRLGVRVATLRAWENDVSEPRANRLSMMAALLVVASRSSMIAGPATMAPGLSRYRSCTAASCQLSMEQSRL